MPLVEAMARRLKRLAPIAELEDLIQSGMLGLIQATKHFRAMPAQFLPFAMPHICSAMLENVPMLDFATLDAKQKVRRIFECSYSLEQKLMRIPSWQEIAVEMGELPEDIQRTVLILHKGRPLRIGVSNRNRWLMDTDDTDPLELLYHRHMINALIKEIGDLPRDEQLLLEHRFRDAKRLDVIGAMLGVSASQVSKLLIQAMARLRRRMPQ